MSAKDEQGRNRRNRAVLLAAGRGMGRAFTVRELHDAAIEQQPSLGLTTAYRAVDRWREEGFAEEAGRRGGEAVHALPKGHVVRSVSQEDPERRLPL